MSPLKQLQLRYEADEDRILLLVSTQEDQEFRFWLTRRYCALLLAVLDKHQARDPEIAERPTQEARRAVRRFKEEAAGTRADFASTYVAPAQRPLGDAPMLAHRLTYRADGDRIRLAFAPREGRGVTFTLDGPLGLNFRSMLAKTIRVADWRLLPAEPTATTEPRIVN